MRPTIGPTELAELQSRFGSLTPLAEGAWSTAFRTRRLGRDVVVRVGHHITDFRADQEAAALRSASLPVPNVLEIDRLASDTASLFVCVTEFVPGVPLEDVVAEQWISLVPAVADLLTTLRSIHPEAAVDEWPVMLRTTDALDRKLPGWRQQLARWPTLRRAHDSAIARLDALCEQPIVASVEPSLVHGDLLNRNAHVLGSTITGVFDWGSRQWGDHLYDLAWFVFWAPWHPNLDVNLLVDDVTRRWGQMPDPTRLHACLTHIGADHIAYNAATDNPVEGEAVAARLLDLDPDLDRA